MLSSFFRERGYERLGYASDGQYARERLGMSRSAAWERVQLARRTRRLEALADAVRRGEVGTHAARLVAGVATRETERARIERAKTTTFKFLREDVRIVETAVRLEGDGADRRPPDAERVAKFREWRSDVLSGEMFRRAVQMSGCESDEGRDAVQLSGSDVGAAPAFPFTASVGSPAGNARRGEVDVHLRLPKDVAVFWMELENLFDYAAIDVRFRAHGGGDEADNQTSPCFRDHIEGIHAGRLRVSGTAPDGLEWVIGRRPIMVVRGRERTLVG